MEKAERTPFHFVMIKPSHYDDDGYVIQWRRSQIPSNTLAVLYSLALECVERRVLGDDVEIRLHAYDETNIRIKLKKIIKEIKDAGGAGLIGFIGVQTNQFPRAMDMARQFRAASLPVCIGGFHVSGCMAMLPDMSSELQEALDLGITLFAGEAEEGRLEALLKDAYHNRLKPVYNYLNDLPGLEGAIVPFMPAERIKRTVGKTTSFDAGRGCPFLCSFCTIINVQGRKSRCRSADDVEEIVRRNLAQGIHAFFITDDNIARNREWESIFDRLIHLREAEGLKCKLTIQVDTMCHKVPGFIKKARQAGVKKAFIGLENINPESLGEARKGQNRITEYRAMLQAWQKVGVMTIAGYIIGFPADTPDSVVRDIRIIQRELPVDLLEFFILTPLPGSADHKKLYEGGAPLEPDLNNYDTVHVNTPHAKMTKQELENLYRLAWETYYSPEHVETLMRRATMPRDQNGVQPRALMRRALGFYACLRIEGVHPLEGGFFRLKYRRDRRPGRPIENPLVFYSRYTWEIVSKYYRFLWMAIHYYGLQRRVMTDTTPYTDLAMKPVPIDEMGELDLFNTSNAAEVSLHKVQHRKSASRRVAVRE